ncbi:MAG: hypothetical protein HEQ40_12325 [Lacibacter sp.]
MCFKTMNILTDLSSKKKYDVVFFNSSLHHLPNVRFFLKESIVPVLNDNGLVIIFEYTGPNRLQFPSYQINAINDLLKQIPESYRRRYKTNKVKHRVSGPGIIRMILADPSECIDSASIIPSLHELFEVVEEKKIGDNLMMLLLKDIAHHFCNELPQTKMILQMAFKKEEEYLFQNKADFVFGVYSKKG